MTIDQDVPTGATPAAGRLFDHALVMGPPPDGIDDDTGWTADDVFADQPDPDLAAGSGWGPAGWLSMFARQRSQVLTRFLHAVHAIGHPGAAARDEFAVDEVANALGWSHTMAGRWLVFADDVIDRLPTLHDALADGRIDESKARAFSEWTCDMPDDLARMVAAQVLPVAGRVSRAELIERIGAAACALDSDWARRCEETALRRVRVEGRRTPLGTADISARDLTPADGTAIMTHTEALAGPIKRAGVARGFRVGIAAVRALVHARLLDGSCSGLDDDEVIDRLVDELPAWLRTYGLLPDDGPHGGPDGGGPHSGGPDDDGGDDDGGDNTDGGCGPDDGPDDGSDDDAPGAHGSATAGPEERPAGRIRAGTSELRLRLSTVLGLDELPAQVPTWGMVTAPSARDMVERSRAGGVPCEWRLVLVDRYGHLEHVVLVRPGRAALAPPDRPGGPRRDTRRRGRGTGKTIVELAAATTMLAALDPEQHPGWTTMLRHAQRRLAGLPDRHAEPGGPAHPATSTADALRRRPGRELDRWTRVRDRHCLGAMCTRPAHGNDLDHTRDWIDDGPTVAGNLGGCCRHCHRLKHVGGWRLTQPEAGRFVWRSPTGAAYVVHPRPVLEKPPAPAPRADGRPRPVPDPPVDGPPTDDRPAWVDARPERPVVAAEVPARPVRRPPTGALDDEPPF